MLLQRLGERLIIDAKSVLLTKDPKLICKNAMEVTSLKEGLLKVTKEESIQRSHEIQAIHDDLCSVDNRCQLCAMENCGQVLLLLLR